MARKYRKYSRKFGGRTRRRRISMYRKKKYASRAFAKRVMKVVYKHSETKSIEATLLNTTFNSAIDNTTDMYNILPAIAVGGASTARIGEKVLCKGITVTGVARWTPLGDGEPGTAYIFVLEDKRDKNTNLNVTDQFNFLLGNSNQAVNFDGTFPTALRPMFSERYRLLAKRVFKFQYDQGTSLTDNASELYKAFKIKIRRRNMIFNYDGATLSFPQNKRIMLCAGYCRQDGVVDVLDTRLAITANVRMWYKDL